MSKTNVVKIYSEPSDLIAIKSNKADEFGIPILKIHVDYPEIVFKTRSGKSIKDDSCTITYYLSPFREYSFQVSETIDGRGDAGSSVVLNLHNLINISGSQDRSNVWWNSNEIYRGRGHAIHHLTRGIISEAIERFISYQTSKYDGYKCVFECEGARKFAFGEGDMLDQFTDTCVAFLMVKEGKQNLCSDELLLKYYTLPVYDFKGERRIEWNMDVPSYLLDSVDGICISS